jgi:hypothetical protein
MSEPSDAADWEVSIFWTIISLSCLLAVITAIGLSLGLLAEQDGYSSLGSLAGAFKYIAMYGTLLFTPVFLFCGFAGIILMRRDKIRKTKLLMVICLSAVSIPPVALGKLLYWNRIMLGMM